MSSSQDALTPEAKDKLKNFAAAMQATYQVDRVDEAFSAPTPQIEHTLVRRINESSSLLSVINTPLVKHKSGKNIYLNGQRPISSRTNTGLNTRKPKSLGGVDSSGYETAKHEDDHGIPYETLNEWAYLDNFNELLLQESRETIAEARVKVLWNGKEVAAQTDPIANPMGEDLNIGVLQYLRNKNTGTNVVSQISVPNEVRIGGPQGDFSTVDELVLFAKTLVPRHLRKDIVSFMGDDLLLYGISRLTSNAALTPSEKKLLIDRSVVKEFGTVPLASDDLMAFFPERGLFLTPLKNMSMYTQRGSVNQHFRNEPERDQFAYYNTANVGYSLEDHRRSILVEPISIKFWDEISQTYV